MRILVVANPTGDLEAAEVESDAVVGMAGTHGDVTVEVTRLAPAKATPAALRAAVEGPGVRRDPHCRSRRVLTGVAGRERADVEGWRATRLDDVARLAWAAPPYIVFNSACESAWRGPRSPARVACGPHERARGRFLAAGAEAYIGHFWPVDDWDAAMFATTFYQALFERVNVGGAVLEARRAVMGKASDQASSPAPGAVFFGDAGTAERRDLASAA